MKLQVWAGLLAIALAMPVQAQKAPSPEQALKTAVLGQQLYLRNFSADKEILAHWDGSTFTLDQPILHAVAAFTATSVKIKARSVEMAGTLQLLLRYTDHMVLSASKNDVTVKIELGTVDPLTVVPELRSRLFFTRDEALASLPTTYIPAMTVAPKDGEVSTPSKRCDCNGDTCKANDQGKDKLTPPKIIRSVAPEYTDEASRHKVSGTVQIGMYIETTGEPYNLWLVNSIGMGLDESAARALHQYAFRPATCGNRSVLVNAYVNVNFIR